MRIHYYLWEIFFIFMMVGIVSAGGPGFQCGIRMNTPTGYKPPPQTYYVGDTFSVCSYIEGSCTCPEPYQSNQKAFIDISKLTIARVEDEYSEDELFERVNNGPDWPSTQQLKYWYDFSGPVTGEKCYSVQINEPGYYQFDFGAFGSGHRGGYSESWTWGFIRVVERPSPKCDSERIEFIPSVPEKDQPMTIKGSSKLPQTWVIFRVIKPDGSVDILSGFANVPKIGDRWFWIKEYIPKQYGTYNVEFWINAIDDKISDNSVMCKSGSFTVQFPPPPPQPQKCTLDVYTWDQDGHRINGNIYIDGTFWGSSHVTVDVDPGWYTVRGELTGYNPDQETVECPCGQTVRVDLVLSERVCTPGEVRNKHCICPTQYQYEQCKPDGSGWETKTGTCPSGTICEDGECVPQLPEFEIDVYNVDTSPYRVDKGDDVKISGKIKLVKAPSGYHEVTVKLYVDNSKEREETIWMYKDDIETVSWNFDTSCLSEGKHDVKIKAVVNGVSDEDINYFYVEEEKIEIEIGELDIHPDLICRSEDETVELSVRITLERGPDNTLVTAKFYVEDDGQWDYIGKDEERLDEDETKTFRIDYDYEAYDLDIGIHEVKVIVQSGDEEEEDREELHVKSCEEEELRDIEIGFITLDPETPLIGDIVTITSSVKLVYTTEQPETVYTTAYIDGREVRSFSLEFYYIDQEIPIQFTFDTDEYGVGTHTVEIKGRINSKIETRSRHFSISGIPGVKDHCLEITKIQPLYDAIAGERVQIDVYVRNCGDYEENDVKIEMKGFGKTYYDGVFYIPIGEEVRGTFTLNVPDKEGIETLKFTAWNYYTSTMKSYDLTVITGIPFIDLKPEYKVYINRTNKIEFTVSNLGDAKDTFTISVKGEASNWIKNYDTVVTLNPGESKKITAEVILPECVEEGYYDFTVMVTGSYAEASSRLKVVEPWEWFKLPTGMFVEVLNVLPWLLLLLLLLLLLWVLWVLSKRIKKGRKVSVGEETFRKFKISIFDECCEEYKRLKKL